MNPTPTKRTKANGLLEFIDRNCPEQRAIAFYILKDRQRRKAEAADKQKRGAK